MKKKFYRQNNILKTDKKKFYRKLGKSQMNVEKPPSKEEVETFWTSVWGTEKEKKLNDSNGKKSDVKS